MYPLTPETICPLVEGSLATTVIGTVNELAVVGTVNVVTIGIVISEPGGDAGIFVTFTYSLRIKLFETLPAASFAQAYRVFAPPEATV